MPYRRLRMVRRVAQYAFIGALALAAIPGLAGATSTGGPWTYVQGPITCQFTGSHSALTGNAYSQTQDYNGGCADLGTRLKYKIGVDTFIIGWSYSTPSAPGTYTIYSAEPSTAVASEHKAMNGWNSTWSSVQRPHAF